MDDLFNFDINFPVPRFKYLLFVTLLPIPPDSYRDKAEQRLLKVCASVAVKGNCASIRSRIPMVGVCTVPHELPSLNEE